MTCHCNHHHHKQTSAYPLKILRAHTLECKPKTLEPILDWVFNTSIKPEDFDRNFPKAFSAKSTFTMYQDEEGGFHLPMLATPAQEALLGP